MTTQDDPTLEEDEPGGDRLTLETADEDIAELDQILDPGPDDGVPEWPAMRRLLVGLVRAYRERLPPSHEPAEDWVTRAIRRGFDDDGQSVSQLVDSSGYSRQEVIAALGERLPASDDVLDGLHVDPYALASALGWHGPSGGMVEAVAGLVRSANLRDAIDRERGPTEGASDADELALVDLTSADIGLTFTVRMLGGSGPKRGWNYQGRHGQPCAPDAYRFKDGAGEYSNLNHPDWRLVPERPPTGGASPEPRGTVIHSARVGGAPTGPGSAKDIERWGEFWMFDGAPVAARWTPVCGLEILAFGGSQYQRVVSVELNTWGGPCIQGSDDAADKLRERWTETVWLVAEAFGADRDALCCHKVVRHMDRRELGTRCGHSGHWVRQAAEDTEGHLTTLIGTVSGIASWIHGEPKTMASVDARLAAAVTAAKGGGCDGNHAQGKCPSPPCIRRDTYIA